MKTYYVDYTYENSWQALVSNQIYFETEKEAKDFIQRLNNRTDKIISLTLITYDKMI